MFNEPILRESGVKVILGNSAPHNQGVPVPGPAITISEIKDLQNEDGTYVAGYVIGTSVAEVKEQLYEAQIASNGLVTHMPGNGAVLNVIQSWPRQSFGKPEWVAVEPDGRSQEEAEDFERFLSEFWGCDRGIPGDVEDNYYTAHGDSDKIYAPGEAPEGD